MKIEIELTDKEVERLGDWLQRAGAALEELPALRQALYEEAPRPEKQHDVWGEAHLAGYGLSLGIRQMLHSAWKWALPPGSDHLEAAWLRLLGTAVDVIQDLHSSATPADIVKETLRRHKLEPPTHDWLMAEQKRIGPADMQACRRPDDLGGPQ